MENQIKKFYFSKPKSRTFSQSIEKIFGLPEENLNEDFLNDKEFDIENKKPLSLEKLNITAEIIEDKETVKSRKTKKTEGQPAAIKTFCRIRPTDSKNGIFLFN